ncbi:hypothetical protein K438DRAFT_1761798 [Mycena galopus ATCC 62051]|nr:hypothetical protein K438DRAFT_1761798 [Mycena galopus ATCC 62051]
MNQNVVNRAVNVAAAATLLESPRTDDLQHIMNERNLIERNPNIRADANPSFLRESGITTMEPKIIHALADANPSLLRESGIATMAPKIIHALADANLSLLQESGITTMAPKIIHALRGFQLKWENIVLREISNSVALAREPMFPTSMRVILRVKQRPWIVLLESENLHDQSSLHFLFILSNGK